MAEKREKLIQVRVTRAEMDTLRAAARHAGLAAPTWLRMLGMAEAAKDPTLRRQNVGVYERLF